MEIQITGRHVDVTDAMRQHIGHCVEKLPRFADRVLHIAVTVDMDSGNPRVEVLAKYPRAELVAEATTHDMYKSIDEAFARLERRLHKHHDKRMEHRPGRTPQRAAEGGEAEA